MHCNVGAECGEFNTAHTHTYTSDPQCVDTREMLFTREESAKEQNTTQQQNIKLMTEQKTQRATSVE